MKILALTGGIGMGKSTAALVFRRAGIPVFDADAVVHSLQAPGGRAVRRIAAAFPGTVQGNILNRARLREIVLSDRAELARLERILHPMVRDAERAFVARARRAGRSVVVLDIPLLFETGGECRADIVVVVSAPRSVQESRVRRRGHMSSADVAAVISRQMPDREKRRRADVVIETGLSRRHTLRSLTVLIRSLRK